MIFLTTLPVRGALLRWALLHRALESGQRSASQVRDHGMQWHLNKEIFHFT